MVPLAETECLAYSEGTSLAGEATAFSGAQGTIFAEGDAYSVNGERHACH